MERNRFFSRLVSAASKAVSPALSSIRFLLTIMLPVSLLVLLLDHSGILYYTARFLDPVMRIIGLPGEASLVFLSSVFLNIYSAIAVIQNLSLSGREIAILASMCLIAHNLIVECAVMGKTGSNPFKMAALRICFALIAGFLLNLVLPAALGMPSGGTQSGPPDAIGLTGAELLIILKIWIVDSGLLILKMVCIVFGIMVLQKILDEFGIMKALGNAMAPLMAVFGLPRKSGYLWIVANLVGLAYGSAILIEQIRAGALSDSEGDLFNHHVGISHSLLEDSLLFMAIGVPFVWLLVPRLLLAVLLVWLERGRRALFRRSFRAETI
ncbi:transporter [Breznakiella homolactica]|uniref:Transporter n=2 Tax=Breznakiella homolactica TaxID=2798577 RepID=A0A7T7XRZ7_9SPIR|nr:transporter [Breznakiella homolactica]